jgi:hypothetical protein
MENHHFSWENPLFLWPFSIAFCMFTRGYSLHSVNIHPWWHHFSTYFYSIAWWQVEGASGCRKKINHPLTAGGS